VELGERPYDELWFLADLRGKQYGSARQVADELHDAHVSALVIAHQRLKDGGRGSFLLVEVDTDAEVIDDWVEPDVEEAKAHGSALADGELVWTPIPDTEDVRAYIRSLLRPS